MPNVSSSFWKAAWSRLRPATAGVIATTRENLAAAAAGENEEWTELYPEFARVADEEGFPAVAATFRFISKVEAEHEARYRTLLARVEADKVFERDEEIEWQCRNCGYVHKGKNAPEMCPSCSSQGLFRAEEEQLLSAGEPLTGDCAADAGRRSDPPLFSSGRRFAGRHLRYEPGAPRREGLRQVSVDSWPQDRLYRMGDRPVCCLKYFPKKDWLAKWSSSEIWSIVRVGRLEQGFGFEYDVVVDPLAGRFSRQLLDYVRQVLRRQAELVGVERYAPLLLIVLADRAYEQLEELVLSRRRGFGQTGWC